ncbi:hypothetical protein BT63DRAFT_59058 [Microthyrium microscopicum]|uniref:Uncharacterized protein n=1 Tax=Microthyrium microscopicum TaxID=703497 RepID=A0A6A6U475_9PEZI|nr:hypothetical protein BT63DRAFT_59058 [Microthyrium microscopicum]
MGTGSLDTAAVLPISSFTYIHIGQAGKLDHSNGFFSGNQIRNGKTLFKLRWLFLSLFFFVLLVSEIIRHFNSPICPQRTRALLHFGVDTCCFFPSTTLYPLPSSEAKWTWQPHNPFSCGFSPLLVHFFKVAINAKGNDYFLVPITSFGLGLRAQVGVDDGSVRRINLAAGRVVSSWHVTWGFPRLKWWWWSC